MHGSVQALHEGFVLNPGDEITSTCYFRDPTGDVVFGVATEEEICMSGLVFYPRIPYPLFMIRLSFGLDLPECKYEYDVYKP